MSKRMEKLGKDILELVETLNISGSTASMVFILRELKEVNKNLRKLVSELKKEE